jgi:hypothetical protein
MLLGFVDETKEKNYTLVLCLVHQDDRLRFRKTLARARLRGQRSIHFAKESPSRRRQIIKLIVSMSISLIVFNAVSLKSSRARSQLLKELMRYVRNAKIRHLTFDLDESALAQDVRDLNKFRAQFDSEVIWEHVSRNQEPLLWVSDAVAWCVNRGGDWERLVRPLIIETMDC